MRRNQWYIRFALALLMAAGSWQCGGPTGKDDEPQLKVEPPVLDFGTERTSLSLTIENTGSGFLKFQIQIPSEGWITLSQTDGTVVNTPLSVDVRIDREKAPVGDQEVKLVITALRVRLEVAVRASILQLGVLKVSTAALEFNENANQQQLTVSNAGGQALDWQAKPAQPWIVVAPADGRLAPGDEQIVTFTVDLTDQPAGVIQGSVDFISEGGSRSVSVAATVVNRPPVLAPVGDRQVWEGKTLTFELVASDADGDVLSYGVESQPGGSTLVERLFQWTPVRGEAGTYEVTFTVEDGQGGTDRETITITVEETNQAPVLSPIGDQQVEEGETLRVELVASDADGDELSFQVEGQPEGASLSENIFAWAPMHEQAGGYEVTFTVADGQGGTDRETITITVGETNRAPVLAEIGDQRVSEGSSLRIELAASDADADELTYAVSGHPSGSSLSENTFTWEPTHEQAGTYEVTFTVEDGQGGTDRETITITVEETNQAPVLSPIGDQQVEEGETLRVELVASDADGDELSFQVEGQPEGASLSENIFAWAPMHEQAGGYEVTFTVADGQGGTDRETITITVGETNRAPVLAEIGDQRVSEGSSLRIELAASDADADELTYAVSGHPSGSSLSENTFTWEPTHEQAGTYEVTFTVEDGQGGTDRETITITVEETNQAPVLSPIGDQQVEEGETLRVELVASDADGDELSFQVEGQPEGASLSENIFAWAPMHEQAGGYEVTFTVADGQGGTDRETITITVGETNRAPVLAEIGDQRVSEGSSLRIELAASDADADELTYAVSGHPSGSSLSENTFTWEPTHEQAGTYEVTFTVEDGQGGTDRETITITVEETEEEDVGDAEVTGEIEDENETEGAQEETGDVQIEGEIEDDSGDVEIVGEVEE